MRLGPGRVTARAERGPQLLGAACGGGGELEALDHLAVGQVALRQHLQPGAQVVGRDQLDDLLRRVLPPAHSAGGDLGAGSLEDLVQGLAQEDRVVPEQTAAGDLSGRGGRGGGQGGERAAIRGLGS
jgi:hypothetical protein